MEDDSTACGNHTPSTLLFSPLLLNLKDSASGARVRHVFRLIVHYVAYLRKTNAQEQTSKPNHDSLALLNPKC